MEGNSSLKKALPTRVPWREHDPRPDCLASADSLHPSGAKSSQHPIPDLARSMLRGVFRDGFVHPGRSTDSAWIPNYRMRAHGPRTPLSHITSSISTSRFSRGYFWVYFADVICYLFNSQKYIWRSESLLPLSIFSQYLTGSVRPFRPLFAHISIKNLYCKNMRT